MSRTFLNSFSTTKNVMSLAIILILVTHTFTVIQTQPVNDKDMRNSLYEMYKIMRTDPRLQSLSNEQIVLLIHKNVGNKNWPDSVPQQLKKEKNGRKMKYNNIDDRKI
ncbi:unnamed protein product [Didymodactylos carnosus]|uniref:Uncharacterized protein n=1 Tax=Didymodactylos carnosus TaxID=1234261 RepID=A0A8S2FHJ0_9BILA|nr:unnamed protein product [Didymodactylos carnosus]CAF4262744.1 unnamed protein product [Didymodactylos carnosus]